MYTSATFISDLMDDIFCEVHDFRSFSMLFTEWSRPVTLPRKAQGKLEAKSTNYGNRMLPRIEYGEGHRDSLTLTGYFRSFHHSAL